jgi:dephospho-CoA kinase
MVCASSTTSTSRNEREDDIVCHFLLLTGIKVIMLNVGLTGGIATGKSMVVKLLANKGARIIDFDHLTRYVQEPGRPAWNELVSFFGRDILKDDMTINRRRLGEIVFPYPPKLARLNSIVHPFIIQEWQSRLTVLRENNCDGIVISDAPLLIEAGDQKDFDLIILVYAPPWQQLERLRIRNGYNVEEARQRLSSQLPIDLKVPYADVIIDNSTSREKTSEQVDSLWDELKKRVQ